MKPILFESTETQFTSNGLGRIDAISCVVTEARNGQYELEMEVSIDDEHYSDITEGRILYVRHDETQDKQPFDIYYISRPLNGIVTVLAHHVSYRTESITVMPFSAVSASQALLGLGSNSVGENPFTFWTDKSTTGNFTLTEPKTIRSLLAGEEGSILDVYGTGEYEWDRFNIKLHLHRGTDSGVVLRYGKDLTELTKVTDMSEVWTAVVPFWRGTADSDSDTASEDEIVVTLPEKSIAAPGANAYPHQMVVPLDLSGSFESQPTEAQLRQKTTEYVNNNFKASVPTTIEFSFVNLADLEEYKEVAALQRLKLCDSVTVVYEKLGVSNTAKIIETQFDVLKEKYINMTVGDTSQNLSTALTGGIKDEINSIAAVAANTAQKIKKLKNDLEDEIEQTVADQTALITGGNGGNVVLTRNANGQPTEILVMDNIDVNQAVQVLRINVNGIGFSSHGINGPYSSAWTLDGKFNADFIQAGTLNANVIRAGTISDANNKNSWNLDTGSLTLTNGSINIGNGMFSVNSSGQLVCSSADINGKMTCADGNSRAVLEDAELNFFYNNTPLGTLHVSSFGGVGMSYGDAEMGLDSSNIYMVSDGIWVSPPGELPQEGANKTLYLVNNEGSTEILQFINGICVEN